MKVRTIVAAVAVAAWAVPVATLAQTVRQAQPVTRSVAPAVYRSTTKSPQKKFRPIKIGPHTFYGTITAINGTSIRIITRRQRVVDVDATNVLAEGSYSAPLFIGKLVTVDGDQSASGIFTAAHIFRMTNLNSLPSDH